MQLMPVWLERAALFAFSFQREKGHQDKPDGGDQTDEDEHGAQAKHAGDDAPDRRANEPAEPVRAADIEMAFPRWLNPTWSVT